MRIALIAHHAAPVAPPFLGGLEAQTWSLASWLVGRGHEVTLIAPPGSHVPGAALRPLALHGDGGSTSARRDVSSAPRDVVRAHHAYLRELVQLGRECPFDVVHVNAIHHLPPVMAEAIPAPMLLSLHCPPTPWLESSLSIVKGPTGLPIAVNAVSHALAEEWQHVAPEIAVVRNGVDLDLWPAGPGGLSAVWSGRIVPEKAPHLAIDAARLAGQAIRLAGPICDEEYWTRKVVPRLGADATYVGHLEHPELAELLGTSSVSVQPPVWNEPFGLAAAEAIATGTPVAAFGRAGLLEVVGARSGVLAPPGDVEGLAAAIVAATQLDRGAVREDAEQRLGIDAMGSQYETLYGQLVVDRMEGSLRPRARRGRPSAPDVTRAA